MAVEVVETIETSEAISALTRAELDVAITTARAYPRSVSRFRKEAIELCTLNEQVAKECLYAVPRDGSMIEGPSARLAEIVASCWGNCRASARVVEEGAEFITAQGVFHDLERNVAISYEVKRRITGRNGRRYSPDMIATTGNAASSIALRNAVFKGVPKALWTEAYQAARKIVAGDAQTFSRRRAETVDTAKKFGVTPERIFAVLGVEGLADIGVDELVRLTALIESVRNEEITLDVAFPPVPKPGTEEKPTAATAATSAPAKGGVAGVKAKVGAKPAAEADKGEGVPAANASDGSEAPADELDVKIAEAREALGMTEDAVEKLMKFHRGDKAAVLAALNNQADEGKKS